MSESIFSNPFLQSVIIIIIAFVFHRFGGIAATEAVHRLLKKHPSETLVDKRKRGDTLSSIFRTSVGLVVWLVAVFLVLGAFHINLAQVATGAGFLGIIIGLGAQATIRDYLAGMFILGENQYRVGDIVTLNGAGVSEPTSGVVEDISLRITKLRDLNGTLHIVRNGEATIVTNRTFEYSSVVIDVGVTYNSDIDLIEKLINRVGKDMLKNQELAKDIKEPIHFMRIDDFSPSGIMIKMIGKVSPATQWDIEGQFRRKLLEVFRENNVKIALPQIVVHQTKE